MKANINILTGLNLERNFILSILLTAWLTLMCALSIGCASTQGIASLSADPIPVQLTSISASQEALVSIPPPHEVEENQIWDAVDKTFIYQVGKWLDLGWTARRLGALVGLVSPQETRNVNDFDEVFNSTWFTNRQATDPFGRPPQPLSLETLVKGPNETEGPDQSSPWEIISGKFEGGSSGLLVKDRRGDLYMLKFDHPNYPEMSSAAEAITTGFFYAAGYNVPQNTIVVFDPSLLKLGKKAKTKDKYKRKRPMTEDDLSQIIAAIPKRPDGKVRALASKFLSGKPAGPFNFHGRRQDDPNDRINHEDRRELRGLRVISAWLNDTDRRAANTLDMYVKENGKGFLKHYLIDFGSTLGSNYSKPKPLKYGNEYTVDARTAALSLVTLGIYPEKWQKRIPMPHSSAVGYFESEHFHPKRWVPTYPNPAFEKMTVRDAYWGAKIVTSYTDEQIRAIVKTGQLSDPKVEEHLIQTLQERRDKVGGYWFSRIAPLDGFELRHDSDSDNNWQLCFHDLAVERGYAQKADATYRYMLDQLLTKGERRRLAEGLLIDGANCVTIESQADLLSPRILEIRFQVRRHPNVKWSQPVTVGLIDLGQKNGFWITQIKRN